MTLDMYCNTLLTVSIIVLITSLVSHMACQQLEIKLLIDHNNDVGKWRELFMVVKKQRDDTFAALDLAYKVLKVIADPNTNPEQSKEALDTFFKTVGITHPEMELKEAAESIPDNYKLGQDNNTL